MTGDAALLALAGAPMDWPTLGYAIALLALAIVLLVLEFFIVSFGLLLAASFASAGGAIYLAFLAHDLAGWTMTAAIPVLAVGLTRWGLKRIRTSRLVPQSEITAEAGYHHLADGIGVGPGSRGVMVTPARPSGRARFAGGECDVQAQSGALERDARVVVKHIDGPVVFVSPVPAEAPCAPAEAGEP